MPRPSSMLSRGNFGTKHIERALWVSAIHARGRHAQHGQLELRFGTPSTSASTGETERDGDGAHHRFSKRPPCSLSQGSLPSVVSIGIKPPVISLRRDSYQNNGRTAFSAPEFISAVIPLSVEVVLLPSLQCMNVARDARRLL